MHWLWPRIEQLAGALSQLALGCLVVLPFVQVIARDFFSSPITGLEEATRWGLIALVYLGLPLLVARDAQIRFPELIDQLPRRARLALERIIVLLAAGAFGVMMWAAMRSILQNTSTRTPVLDIPFWLFAAPFLIGLLLSCIGCLWVGLRRAAPPTDGGAAQL